MLNECKCDEPIKGSGVVVDGIDVGVGVLLPCEVAYHCQACDKLYDYWSYGVYESEAQKSTPVDRRAL